MPHPYAAGPQCTQSFGTSYTRTHSMKNNNQICMAIKLEWMWGKFLQGWPRMLRRDLSAVAKLLVHRESYSVITAAFWHNFWSASNNHNPNPTLTFWTQNQQASTECQELLLCQVSSHSDQLFLFYHTHPHTLFYHTHSTHTSWQSECNICAEDIVRRSFDKLLNSVILLVFQI